MQSDSGKGNAILTQNKYVVAELEMYMNEWFNERLCKYLSNKYTLVCLVLLFGLYIDLYLKSKTRLKSYSLLM